MPPKIPDCPFGAFLLLTKGGKYLPEANELLKTLTSACGACRGLQHLRGHEIDLGVVCSLDTAFDPQHFSNSVLISMADLKFLPCLPEFSCHLRKKFMSISETFVCKTCVH